MERDGKIISQKIRKLHKGTVKLLFEAGEKF